MRGSVVQRADPVATSISHRYGRNVHPAPAADRPSGNPYRRAWARSRANRRRVEPWADPIRVAIGVATTLVLIPLARPVFLGFLDLGPDRLGEGAEAVLSRLVLAIIGFLTLEMYTALVRGPDRAVLEILPVDGAAIAEAEVGRVGSGRLWIAIVAVALLVPIAREASIALWLMCALVVAGAFVLGLFASAVVHLAAVDAAQSPAWAPLLDALRGANAREQAAFIYAPGVVLAIAGGVGLAAAHGVRVAWDGNPLGLLLIALPVPAAVAFAVAIPGLARRTWAKASPILADIDARYAAFERPEDMRRVYLDWAVRFLPADIGRYALKDLRHGWRARRSWITGAWIAGVLAAFAGWSGDAGAPARSAAAVVVAVFAVAGVSVVLERDEPPFLQVWLPDGGLARRAGRAFALLLWLQGCAWPAIAATAVRHGSGGALRVAEGALAAMVVATIAAIASGSLRERALFVYAPIAAIAAASLGAVFAGGGL